MSEQLHETQAIKERFVIFAADTKGNQKAADQSLSELEQLTVTLGAEVTGRLVQNMDNVHSAHYLGKGKLDELKDLIYETNANGVICDDELSPAQYRNLTEILNVKVLDRTAVILDIFAGNAKSAEAIAQVELAQLTYKLTRLKQAETLTRQGGGIGTRGPGEKKLETDRRYIRERITRLKSELKELETRRTVTRTKRERTGLPLVALVGYTNAGKSTIMNLLTDAGVVAENRLFATLDTTTRLLKTPSGGEFLLSDTVGFIQKLPHSLVKAFRATLEESSRADILIHVVDSSAADYTNQTKAVYKTLLELSAADKPVITVFNKLDIIAENTRLTDENAVYTLPFCALTGEGKDSLYSAIDECIRTLKTEINALIPYSKSAFVNMIHKQGEVISEEYKEEGTLIRAYVPLHLAGALNAGLGNTLLV